MKKVLKGLFAVAVGVGAGYVAYKNKDSIVKALKSKKVQTALALLKKI